MILGLAFFTPLGLAGSVFYIAHHIIVKTNLFLIGGVMEWLRRARHLSQVGGLYRDHPGLALLFLISGLSLAGIPPLSGFFAKLILIKAGLDIGEYLAVGVALLVGLLTLFSMTKIWIEAFWKPQPDGPTELHGQAVGRRAAIHPTMWLPIAGLAGITLAIGILVGPLLSLCSAAAEQLLDQRQYIRAVLGDAP
jgi:multicomponent Na+:H+ antiporter subunit D